MTWREKVYEALENLGGIASLKDIYEYIELNYKSSLSDSWKASVRAALERASSDSEAYEGKYDLFYSVDGIGKGFWGIRDYKVTYNNMNINQYDYEFSEGKKVLKKHILRERDTKAVYLAKNRFKELNGNLRCEICGFDFEKVYGELGKDFIECHHTKPVSQMPENYIANINDFLMVCSNCHSMLHRKKICFDKEVLKQLIEKNKLK